MISLTPYCTQGEMERFFSAQGVTAFSDHDESGANDTGVVDDCIERATTEITDLAHNWYDQTGLLLSPTVKRWAVVVATFYLCELRGNPVPESIANDYMRIMGPGGFLERLAEGKYKLAGVPMRAALVPTFSNLTVDRRYQRSNVRVTNNSSTETSTRQQDTSRDVPGSYGF
jgi:phage gp36-like protein